MNRKQAGIILTLIGLIVCVGILATKVNGDFNSTELTSKSEEENKVTEKEKDKENSKESDFFYESKNEKEKIDSQTIQSYKGIIDDKNTSKEKKDETTKKLNELTTNRNYETRIELSVKGKGFDDALCLMQGDKVRVVVKAEEGKISDKQAIQIQESVHAVAKTKDVVIEVKQ